MLKKFAAGVAGLAIAAVAVAAIAAEITGAGATFVYPVYRSGSAHYKTLDRRPAELPVDRLRRRHRADQGGNGRLRRFRQAAELRQELSTSTACCSFPCVIGGIMPVVNIPGIAAGQIKFTGPCSQKSIWAR